MRVAIELTALELDRGGTARAIEQLLPRLHATEGLELIELRQPGDAPSSAAGRIMRGLKREIVYMPRTLPRLIREAGVDVVHCPSPLVPPKSDAPLAVTIHDAIGWDHPEWLTRANVAQLKTRLPKAIAAGAHVITSSQYSKQRIVENLGIDQSRVSVVTLGLDERFSPGGGEPGELEVLGVRAPFVLTVGTLQPRKNLAAAIEAFESIAAEQPGLQLAIAGARGWHDDELVARIERSPVADRIVLLGRVTDEQLIELYRGADLFVFPSRYEGFGFPPLEAMACGTPVISSDRTSLAEVVGDGGIIIDPDDSGQIGHEMLRVLQSPELRQQLIAAGFAHSSRFNWDRCAQDTIAVYETISG